jgi:ribA/ribD-fused uncharacterized protein
MRPQASNKNYSPSVIESFDGKFKFLSNFYSCDVFYDGLMYKNAEAAYQSAKTTDLKTRLYFKNMFPSEAKKHGRKLPLRKDWEEIKYDIMLEIVRNKFKWNKDLKQKLLATKQVLLIEGNWWKDTYWGMCEGVGQNNLGKILMQVRKELLQEEV